MVFSSLTYLFAFLPALTVCYFGLARRRDTRNFILLAFSLLFYSWGGWSLVPLLLLSITINWFFGQRVAADCPHRKLCLVLAVTGNLGLLFIFKYLGFATEILHSLLPAVVPVEIVLPIGISFYTFQGLSYVLDVYMGRAAPTRKIPQVALYIALFPQLVAGPIVRYTTVCQELDTRRETVEDAFEGVIRFCFGLARKVLIANQLGALADAVFAQSSLLMSSGLAWLGVIGYSLQIYFDFSGYSDMAIGLGRIFGFHFLENFNYPFISKSATEFWRRWHMSLGSWFRDYVYIPMGGNRVSRWRWLINIFTVWLLTGFWHGAAWTFIIWGLFFGVLLIVEKLWLKQYLDKSRLLGRIYILFAVVISFIIFNAVDMSAAMTTIGHLFGAGGIPLATPEALYYLRSYAVIFVLAIIGSTPAVKLAARKAADSTKWGRLVNLAEPVVLAVLIIVIAGYLVDGSFNPFLYFRF